MKIKTTKGLICAGVMSASLAMPMSVQAAVKNVIMMIGDGMGVQQVGLLETYANRAASSPYNGEPTGLAKLAKAGKIVLSRTNPIDTLVVDSACSATQLAIGEPTLSEVIGIDAEGNRKQTVLELAESMGKSTGLVSDTRLTHATPASFAAHVAHRSMENTIAEQMLEADVDVLLSGGARHFLPKSVNEKGVWYDRYVKRTGGAFSIKSKRKDDRDLLKEADRAGYQLAYDWKKLRNIEEGKILGLFANSAMYNGIKWEATKDTPQERTQPTLKEMTMKALDILSQNDKGFFLMVEGGLIDWAGHENDTGTMLHELLKFDETINYVYEWAAQRDDTLVVVTADHETGGFGFSYNAVDVPETDFSKSGTAFEGLGYTPQWNFGDLSILDKLAGQTKAHSALYYEFSALPAEEQTSDRLAEMLNESNEFKVTAEMASVIMKTEANEFFKENHSYLSAETWPKIDDFKSFYVYGEENRADLIGRVLSEQQHTVWGTGTHTDTPVGVFIYGPKSAKRKFDGIMTHPEVGAVLKKIVSKN